LQRMFVTLSYNLQAFVQFSMVLWTSTDSWSAATCCPLIPFFSCVTCPLIPFFSCVTYCKLIFLVHRLICVPIRIDKNWHCCNFLGLYSENYGALSLICLKWLNWVKFGFTGTHSS
jgi:hypothetical protein